MTARGAGTILNERTDATTDWQLANLADILDLLVDGSHNPPPRVDVGLPMISARNVEWGSINQDGYRPIGEEAFEVERRRAGARCGDVLLTIVGSIGRAAVVSASMPAFALQRSVAVLRPKDLDPTFLMYQLLAEPTQKWLRDHAKGTAQQGVYLKTLARLPITFPSFTQQRAIVDEIETQLSRLDAGVEALKRVRAGLKRYRAAVLRAACEGKLVPTEAVLARREGRSYETGAQLLERILAERRAKWQGRGKYREPAAPDTASLPELPEGWAWATWDQVSKWVTYGFTRPMPHVPEGIPIVTAKHVHSGRINMNEADLTTIDAFRALSDKDKPTPGDILITKDGTIGRAAVVETDQPFCINQSVAVVWLRSSPLVRRYLLAAIGSELTQKPIWAKARGVAIQHLSITDFARLPVPMPPIDEQYRIAAEADRRLSVVEQVEGTVNANLRRAGRLRQAVLAQEFGSECLVSEGGHGA